MSNPLVKISLRRRQAQTVQNGASSHKTNKQANFIDIFSENLNLESHQNRCIGSKVTAILLNEWILPTGGVALGMVCPAASAAGLFIVLLVAVLLFLEEDSNSGNPLESGRGMEKSH